MKFFKRLLFKHYEQAQDSGKAHVRRRPYILPIFGLVLGLIIVVGVVHANGGRPSKPSSSHVVFLFDQGKEETVDTKAATVGDLVNKLPLKLIPEDVVEPSPNTPIPEDNFRINVYRARPVTVVDNGMKTVTLTAQKSARTVAQNAGVTVYPEDKIDFAQGSIQENIIGEKVVVTQSVPVIINLYGTPLNVRTQAKTVGDLIKEKGIKLGQGETVEPNSTTPINPGMQVFVLRKGAKIINAQEDVPIPVQTVPDNTLSFGTTVIRQNGSTGKKNVTYLINTDASGNEVSRTAIQEIITQNPVPQIVARGTVVDINKDRTSVMAAAGISSDDYSYVNYIVSRESNWNPGSLNAGGCAGLGQACPGSKLANACPNWQNNAVCQLQFFTNYANRYGGWGGSYNFWLSHHYW